MYTYITSTVQPWLSEPLWPGEISNRSDKQSLVNVDHAHKFDRAYKYIYTMDLLSILMILISISITYLAKPCVAAQQLVHAWLQGDVGFCACANRARDPNLYFDPAFFVATRVRIIKVRLYYRNNPL
jgi:hypothetical protein